MKRYSEYKDSGVKWIGEIPEHWKCTRIKFIANLYGRIGFRGYNSKDLNKDGIGAITLSPSNMKDMMMDYTNVTYLSWEKYNESPEIMIQQGDILFVKTGSSYGKSCYVDNLPQEATINPQILRINPLINGRFLCYYFNSSLARTFTECGVVGGTIPTISQEKVGNFIALNPPLSEQQAIVTYLDTKVAKIDEYISIAEKKISALEELKQTIIAEAVTRGIHKEVPMKDSGVKWIGMIPEHWKVMRLSQIAYEHFISNKKIHHQNLLSLSYGQIIRKDINGTNGLLPASFDTYQVVEEGNIILRLTDLQNDHKSLRVGLVKETGIITSAYLCLAPKNMVYSKFLYFQLHACDIKKVFYSMGDGLRQSLNYDGMRKLASVIPPLPEQQEIVTYIEAKVAKIDQLCQAERSQIEKLKEYKQRLISDVVTGKVKVTND